MMGEIIFQVPFDCVRYVIIIVNPAVKSNTEVFAKKIKVFAFFIRISGSNPKMKKKGI